MMPPIFSFSTELTLSVNAPIKINIKMCNVTNLFNWTLPSHDMCIIVLQISLTHWMKFKPEFYAQIFTTMHPLSSPMEEESQETRIKWDWPSPKRSSPVTYFFVEGCIKGEHFVCKHIYIIAQRNKSKSELLWCCWATMDHTPSPFFLHILGDEKVVFNKGRHAMPPHV
jgi:hypothetical protein